MIVFRLDMNEQNVKNSYTQVIQQNFPKLKVKSIKLLNEGWMSQAFLVNEQYVFLFPKEQWGSDDLKKEIEILPHLIKRVSLSIPKFDYVGVQSNGLQFVEYPMIVGEPMSPMLFVALSENAKERIFEQLAEFMTQVHTFPVEQAHKLGAPDMNIQVDCMKNLESIHQHADELPKEIIQYIEKRTKEYLGDTECHQYEPTLVHGDLAPDHFIFSVERQELEGIIDFGEMAITDPDYDYVYIMRELGTDVAERIMRKRSEKNIEQKKKKVGYYVTFNYVNDIVVSFQMDALLSWRNLAIKELRKESRSNQ